MGFMLPIFSLKKTAEQVVAKKPFICDSYFLKINISTTQNIKLHRESAFWWHHRRSVMAEASLSFR